MYSDRIVWAVTFQAVVCTSVESMAIYGIYRFLYAKKKKKQDMLMYFVEESDYGAYPANIPATCS